MYIVLKTAHITLTLFCDHCVHCALIVIVSSVYQLEPVLIVCRYYSPGYSEALLEKVEEYQCS